MIPNAKTLAKRIVKTTGIATATPRRLWSNPNVWETKSRTSIGAPPPVGYTSEVISPNCVMISPYKVHATGHIQ